jgi:hypothetical protein
MIANTEACHPGEGRKALNRLPQLAEPLLQFDLREELENNSAGKTRGSGRQGGVPRRLRSIQISESFWF